MKRIAILGATGSLGSHVARQAVAAGHDVAVVARSPERLAPEVASRADILSGDLMELPLAALTEFLSGRHAVICCAGFVSEGPGFVALVDRLVTALEALPAGQRPVCWFLAGAALLDLDRRRRRGVDLPKVRTIYWPHAANLERLRRSRIEWRLLCPGPMVDEQPLGTAKLRVSSDRLPATMPTFADLLPSLVLLPLFASRVPQMTIPYADAAAFMLEHLEPDSTLARRRVGLALPVGMKRTKAAAPAATAPARG